MKTAAGMRPVVVVSNDVRNRSLSSVLVARVTAAPKPAIPSVVELPIGEPAIGRVLCDQIAELPKALLGKPLGMLSRAAMAGIDDGLKVALGAS